MKVIFASVLLGLMLRTVLAVDPALYSTPSLQKGQEALCVPIKVHKGKDNAYVESYIKSIDDKDAKVPILMIHLVDLLNVKNIPLMHDYNRVESKDKLLEDGKFKVQVDSGSEFKKGQVVNSYLTSKKDKDHNRLRLKVKQSGYYCVYAAVPDDVESFDIPIIGHSSYGYLNFIEYVYYSQCGLGLLIILVVTGFLFRDLIKSVGKDFLNLNNISVVSKSAVFYILLPELFIGVLQLIADFILNQVAEKGAFSLYARNFVLWLTGCYAIIVQFLTYLFCLGYGVVYYHKQTKSYRELPRSKMNFAKGLLYANMILFLMQLLSKVFVKDETSVLTGTDFRDSSRKDVFQGSRDVFFFMLSMFTFVWLVASIIQGVKTLHTIKEFPPYSSNIENYGEKNQDLRKAFKRSLVLIFLIPIYASLFVLIASIFSTESKLFDQYGYDIDFAKVPYMVNDLMIDSSMGLYLPVWNQFIIGIVVVVGVYFIWVRNNQGLVIDQNEDPEYSQVVAAAEESDPEFV